jgi:CcmD family protein
MPAIPLHTAVSYVAGAYLVFFALILVYVAIMATKLSRIETELSELTDLAIAERAERDPPKVTAAAAAAEAGGPNGDQPKTGALAG